METKKIACGDIMPGCSFQAEAESESELLKKVAEHAADAHGVNEVSPELLATLRSAIKSE